MDKNVANRLLKKAFSCFDRLSTNGKSPTTSSLPPFALSLSKGERRVFQHPAKFFLTLAVNSWQRIAAGSYSLQPCPTQGRKHVLDDRRVFVDEHRFEGLQRDRGQAPTEFGHCSVG